jgi:anti-anti-sigma factor
VVQPVRCRGRLDAATVAQCRSELHRAVDEGTGELVIDLSGVVSVDVTGLGMLLGTADRAARLGRPVVLRGTPVRIARLLRAVGLSRVLRTEGDTVLGIEGDQGHRSLDRYSPVDSA